MLKPPRQNRGTRWPTEPSTRRSIRNRLMSEIQSNQWLLLVYKIPRHATAHRVSVWRKLKQLGALLFSDAVWILPATPQTREQFQWLAAEILELGGQSAMFVSEIAAKKQHTQLVRAFSARTDDYYKQI